MKKVQTKNKLKGLFGLFAAFAMAIGVGVSLAPKESVRTEAATQTLEIVTGDFNTTSYAANNNEKTKTVGGVDYKYQSNQIMQQSSVMQWQKNKGELWNTTAFGTKITSIEITASTTITSLTVRFGSSSKPTSGTSVSSTGSGPYVFTPSGDNPYFYIKTGTLSKTTSVKVNFETGGAPSATLEGISVKEGTAPTKLNYYEGDIFAPAGVVIEALYSDESVVDVTESVQFPTEPLTLGQTSVSVSFGGKTTTISGLTVVAADWTQATQNFNSYTNGVTSGTIDSLWDWVGYKDTASTDTRAWSSEVRIYSGGRLLIEPTSTNSDYKIIAVEFNLTKSFTFDIAVGSVSADSNDLDVVQSYTTSPGTGVKSYSDPNGFRYFSIQNTGGTLQVDDLVVKYKEFPSNYDDVLSLSSNFTRESIAVGESVAITPTILPGGANQAFGLSTSSDKVQILGSSIIGLAEGTNVKVLITTVGKTADGVSLTEEITFDVLLATTTVAEALTLPVGNTVYLIENAKVINGFNTQYDRQIELVDSVDPTKKILVFSYGIQPKESYNYIEGGTITFKAKIGEHEGVNQFIEPQVVSYTDRVEEFAASIMTGDAEGQCETRFADYKELVLTFTEIEMTKLEESQNTVIQSALARYTAWAVHMGAKPFEEGAAGQSIISQNNDNSLTATIIIGVIGLTTLAGYYFLQKKKEA